MPINNFKYNYVIFANNSDYMRVAYNDVINLQGVKYIDELEVKNVAVNFLYRYHTSPRINKLVSLPFKHMWNKYIFNNTFRNKKPICFIFFGCDTRRLNCNIIKYLKNTYIDSKYISFCQDLISTYGDDFQKYRDFFDIIYSFDARDCNKFNLLYHPLVYSSFKIDFTESGYKSDIYFVGKGKDRHELIVSIYKLLREKGLRCNFIVTEVPKDKRYESLGIKYCDGITYYQNLLNINNTNCILEVMQGGGYGHTLRYAEALMYDKKLLTNNLDCTTNRFMNKNIKFFADLNDIDIDFIKENSQIIPVKVKESLSPIEFLKCIDKKLSN